MKLPLLKIYFLDAARQPSFSNLPSRQASGGPLNECRGIPTLQRLSVAKLSIAAEFEHSISKHFVLEALTGLGKNNINN